MTSNEKPTSSFERLFEPGIAISAVTALSYFVGWLYLGSYFSVFNIDLQTVELPASSFLVSSLGTFCIGAIFFWNAYDESDRAELDGFQCFLSNSQIIFFFFLSAYLQHSWSSSDWGFLTTKTFWISMGMLIVFFGGLSYFQIGLKQLLQHEARRFRVMAIIALVLLLCLHASQAGMTAGYSKIIDSGRKLAEYKIELRDGGAVPVTSSPFVIVHRDSQNVYIVPQITKREEKVQTVIIPADRIAHILVN